MSTQKVYLYPVGIRIWHWLNAISFIILIISGLSMQYSSPEFSILPFELSITLHNISGILVVFLSLFFYLFNRFTLNGNYYNANINGLGNRLGKQIRYYIFGHFKGESCPFPIGQDRKFNPLQRLAYILTMYFFLPLLIITGISLFFPEIIPSKIIGINGVLLSAIIHASCGFVCSLFLIVHVYLCTMGKKPGTLFKGMINGYHE